MALSQCQTEPGTAHGADWARWLTSAFPDLVRVGPAHLRQLPEVEGLRRTWVKRLLLLCPLGAISLELVKFGLQRRGNPEASGVEYQQVTLFGYEVREYLAIKPKGRKIFASSLPTNLTCWPILWLRQGLPSKMLAEVISLDHCNRAWEEAGMHCQ